MHAPRHVFSTIFLITALGGAVAHADTATPAPAVASQHHWRAGHRYRAGTFRRVLRRLNLTAEQKTQIKAVFAQARTQLQASRASMRSNHEALATTSPTDPSYPALLATEKSNAATRVQAASDVRTQVYALLTPAQQAQIPALVAADRAAREARVAAWRAQHAQS